MNASMVLRRRRTQLERSYKSTSKTKQKGLSPLSKYLTSSDDVQRFTWWTSYDTPPAMASWEVTKFYIYEALSKRLQDFIAAWEEREHVFSGARSSLIQHFQQRYRYVVGQLENLESFVIADDVPVLSNDSSPSEKFSVASKVVIGVTSPIWVPVGVVAFLLSVPVVGVVAMKEKLGKWNKTRKYEKDKCGFMAKASLEYLLEAAKEPNLSSLVVEQLTEAQVCLEQVVARIPELIKADRMLCRKLTDDNSSQKKLDFYRPLHNRSVHLRDKLAVFGIQEVSIMDISCDDLELTDDQISLPGSDTFTTIHRGAFKQRGSLIIHSSLSSMVLH
ncbi:uncharacterized protein LOC111336043 [Stylophora pistillata]|uniref:uncharacterized protein LOC111336043 n=1 Tax=Stylophora pistillata TaxID=50429 RepID=UPI000C050477|nr:uncharacterized protein LOC111336043 [Stylophora pistillata]